MWDATRALKKRFPDPEELALKVNQILKEPKSTHVMFVTPPTNHFEIFSRLQKEWSYTNPKLLRLLIQRTAASSALEERMESYCQCYRSFCKSLQITTESRIIFEAFDSSKPCLNLTIQKGPLALEEVYIFLEEEFDIHNRYFRIHRIDPGSIKVILQFPASMTEFIKTCIEQKYQNFNWFAKEALESPKHQTYDIISMTEFIEIEQEGKTVNFFAKESPKHHINDRLTCTMKIELPENHIDDKQPPTAKKSSSDSQHMPNPPKKCSNDSKEMLSPQKS